jgi:transitional endoplasmic reticulum ATPase
VSGRGRDRAAVAAYWARNGRCERVPWAEGQVGRAIRLVGRTLGFTRIDTEIVQLAIACSVSSALAALFGLVRLTRREGIADLVSTALGRSARDVRPRLAALAPVFATGLVQLDGDMEPYPGWMIRADPRLISLVREGGVRRDRLLARFLTPEPAPTLALDDFAHLRLDLDAVRRILDSALAKPRPGVNVLFYGPSGVGKTEVARILAADLGAELFAAGAADDDGDSLTAKERLASLRVGHRMLAGVRAVMLWDELEDLDPARPWEQDEGSTRPGKLWLNQLLERNSTPTIWISNSLDALDAAYVRRFTFKLRFPSLGAAQRRRVWTRVAARELTDAEIDERAFAYDLSPGEIASAAEAARARPVSARSTSACSTGPLRGRCAPRGAAPRPRSAPGLNTGWTR